MGAITPIKGTSAWHIPQSNAGGEAQISPAGSFSGIHRLGRRLRQPVASPRPSRLISEEASPLQRPLKSRESLPMVSGSVGIKPWVSFDPSRLSHREEGMLGLSAKVGVMATGSANSPGTEPELKA